MMELRRAVAFVKEVEDNLHAEFQNQTDSVKKIMKVDDERRAQFGSRPS
jgi:hypothetical protein